MFRTILFVHFFIISLFSLNVYAQSNFKEAKIYLRNGKVIEGQLKYDFATKKEIKVYLENKKSKTYLIRKIDSIQVGEDKYFAKKEKMDRNFYKEIETGVVSLYEVNGKFMGIKRNESMIFIVPKSRYSDAYKIFCKEDDNYVSEKLIRDSFIYKVNTYNLSNTFNTDDKVLFDSIVRSTKLLTAKLSVLRPELGLEFKIANRVSLYNSIGMNFYANMTRNASYFVNFDYSGEVRMYYNGNKRLRKGDSNYNFSGPFIAATYKYFIDIDNDNSSIVGFVHGWQENTILGPFYTGYSIISNNWLYYSVLYL
jgi:hypothetical protein